MDGSYKERSTLDSMSLTINVRWRFDIFTKIPLLNTYFRATFGFLKTDFRLNSAFEKLIYSKIAILKKLIFN